jgi:hypothetical protein
MDIRKLKPERQINLQSLGKGEVGLQHSVTGAEGFE